MLSSLSSPGWALLENPKWFREVGLDTETVKRLVLIECRKNLFLLEPLKLEDKKTSQDATVIVGVASIIQFRRRLRNIQKVLISLEKLLAKEGRK